MQIPVLSVQPQSPCLPHTPAKLTIGPRLGSCALIEYLHGRGWAGTRLGTPHRCHWHTFQHNNRFHSSTICPLQFETVKENYFTPLFCHYTINHTNLCSLSDKTGSIWMFQSGLSDNFKLFTQFIDSNVNPKLNYVIRSAYILTEASFYTTVSH